MSRRRRMALDLGLLAVLLFTGRAVNQREGTASNRRVNIQERAARVLIRALRNQQESRPPLLGDPGEFGSPKRMAINASSHEIPLAITAVNKLNTDDWIRDMEFEVENRSNRPVYHVMLTIMFPDVPKTTELDGTPRGLATSVEYGRKEFITHKGELAKEGDIPIKPGEKVILKLEPLYSTGVGYYLKQHNLPKSLIKRVRVRIESLSFGDGSGFSSGSIPFFPRS